MNLRTDPSVAERILDRLVRVAIDDIGLAEKDVQRPKREGNQAVADANGNLPEAWLLISEGEEDAVDDSEGAVGMDTWILPITIDVHLLKMKSDIDMPTLARRWKEGLIASYLADPQITEADGTRLAIDTIQKGKFGPIEIDEMRGVLCGIVLEIRYRHPFADPYTVG